MALSKFESWFVKRILAREVRQGYYHDKRITELYSLINEAVRKEFTEDNFYTHRDFCQDCFIESFRKE